MTLNEEATQIQTFLEIHCSDNPVEIQDRLRMLAVYIARTGKMLADAKKLLNQRKTLEIKNSIMELATEYHLSANVQNTLLKSICVEELYLVDWLDRLNATCVHQSASLITLLSYAKEELRLSKTGY